MCLLTASSASSKSGSSSSTPLVQDYCQWEAFNASCPFGHVIVMESAKFGRMRLGRCVDTDIYIGCAADVLGLFDARCSGRPSCVVQLPDATLHQQQACPKDVVAYLEASYICVDGNFNTCLLLSIKDVVSFLNVAVSRRSRDVFRPSRSRLCHGPQRLPYIPAVKSQPNSQENSQ